MWGFHKISDSSVEAGVGAGTREEAEGDQSHAEGVGGSGQIKRVLEEETPTLGVVGGCGLRGLWRGPWVSC